MKLGTDVYHLSGHCWKGFKVIGQKSKSQSNGHGNLERSQTVEWNLTRQTYWFSGSWGSKVKLRSQIDGQGNHSKFKVTETLAGGGIQINGLPLEPFCFGCNLWSVRLYNMQTLQRSIRRCFSVKSAVALLYRHCTKSSPGAVCVTKSCSWHWAAIKQPEYICNKKSVNYKSILNECRTILSVTVELRRSCCTAYLERIMNVWYMKWWW